MFLKCANELHPSPFKILNLRHLKTLHHVPFYIARASVSVFSQNLTSTSQVKSVPSRRITWHTTSFILVFLTRRRGDWKIEVWPSPPPSSLASTSRSGSLFCSSAPSPSVVTLVSSGLFSALSSTFSSLAGWRSLWGAKKTRRNCSYTHGSLLRPSCKNVGSSLKGHHLFGSLKEIA